MSQKVAILGFGIEGKDAAQYFLKKGVEITVFDKKPKEELDIAGFEDKDISWITGENYLDRGLKNFDLIVRSPGVRLDLTQILDVVKDTKLTSNTQIFLEGCMVPVIGVTGTKGKGTTSTMIACGLESAGKKVFLAGNIGEPMLAGIDTANNSDYAVLELSSFQTMDLTKSPHVVVVTNITSDHMDWHKNQEEYIQAKFNLWAHQTKKDYLVFNWQDKTLHERIGEKPTPGIVRRYSSIYNPECYVYVKEEWNDSRKWTEIWLKGEMVGRADELKVPGKHNLENAMAAVCAIAVLGEDIRKAWKGITAFRGLEHRLEKVAEINGVLYINDSYATNPEPTTAALLSYIQPKILIAGGSEKNADFGQLGENISSLKVKALLLIGTTANRIEKAVKNAGYKGVVEKDFQNMPSVVKRASELATQDDVVLLSPACASFGMFQNYKDRGIQFKKAVLALK